MSNIDTFTYAYFICYVILYCLLRFKLNKVYYLGLIWTAMQGRGRIRGEAPYVENIFRPLRRDANANIGRFNSGINHRDTRYFCKERRARGNTNFTCDFRYGLNGCRFDARIVDEEEVKDDHVNEEDNY